MVTPASPSGEPCGEAVVGVSKTISEGGLGFFHREPIAHREAGRGIRHGQWRADSVSARFELVPLHAAWLVRERRSILADDALNGARRLTVNATGRDVRLTVKR